MVRSCIEHVRYIDGATIECGVYGERATEECSGCKAFFLKPHALYIPTDFGPDVEPAAMVESCKHLGNKLSISPCCGQMYICKLHKGKKCVKSGAGRDPFLTCQTCEDFTPCEPSS